MCITSSFLALGCDLEEVIQSELNIAWGKRNLLTKIKLAICCLVYPNRHIFRWNIEKGTILTHSRRIENCPTPWQRFSDKFPTAGTPTRSTNAQRPGGGWAPLESSDWAIYAICFRLRWVLKSFHFLTKTMLKTLKACPKLTWKHITLKYILLVLVSAGL